MMAITNKKWTKTTFVCVNDGVSIYHFMKVTSGYYTSSPYAIEEFDNFSQINSKFKAEIDKQNLNSNLEKKEGLGVATIQ